MTKEYLPKDKGKRLKDKGILSYTLILILIFDFRNVIIPFITEFRET